MTAVRLIVDFRLSPIFSVATFYGIVTRSLYILCTGLAGGAWRNELMAIGRGCTRGRGPPASAMMRSATIVLGCVVVRFETRRVINSLVLWVCVPAPTVPKALVESGDGSAPLIAPGCGRIGPWNAGSTA